MTSADIAEMLARYDVNPAAEALRTPQEAQAAADIRALAEEVERLRAHEVRLRARIDAHCEDRAAIEAVLRGEDPYPCRSLARDVHVLYLSRDRLRAEVERLKSELHDPDGIPWRDRAFDCARDIREALGYGRDDMIVWGDLVRWVERLKSATLAPETVAVLKGIERNARGIYRAEDVSERLAWYRAGCPDLSPE